MNIKIKSKVCIDNSCEKCSLSVLDDVPKDCPYAILHCFEDDCLGWHQMPRRSGKTTKIISFANELSAKGKTVCVIKLSQENPVCLPHDVTRKEICQRCINDIVEKSYFELEDKGKICL